MNVGITHLFCFSSWKLFESSRKNIKAVRSPFWVEFADAYYSDISKLHVKSAKTPGSCRSSSGRARHAEGLCDSARDFGIRPAKYTSKCMGPPEKICCAMRVATTSVGTGEGRDGGGISSGYIWNQGKDKLGV